MRGLNDKVAIVADEGTAVVAADLNEAAAQSVAGQIRALGGKAAARLLDITDEASYKDLVDFTVKEFGGPDGLFNVAADLSAGAVGRDSDVLSVPLVVAFLFSDGGAYINGQTILVDGGANFN